MQSFIYQEDTMKSRLVLLCLGLVVVCAPLQAQGARFAYVTNELSNSISVYTIDPTTGALALASVAATGALPTSVVIDPTSRFAYVGNNAENGGQPSISAYTIDPNTGVLTQLPGSPFP